MSIDYIMVFAISLMFFATITITAFEHRDNARDEAALHEYRSIADRFVYHIEEVIRHAGLRAAEDFEKIFSPYSTEKIFRFGVEIDSRSVFVYARETGLETKVPLNNPMGIPVSGSAGGSSLFVSVFYSASTGNITVASA